MRRALLLFSFLAAASGCAADPHDSSAIADAPLAERRPPVLPQADSAAPWGGTDRARWRPEAALANAASAALNDAWKDPETRDAVAAVSVTMLGSELFPY